MSMNGSAGWPDYTSGEQPEGQPPGFWVKMRGVTYVSLNSPQEALVLALGDWLKHPTAGS